MKRSVAAIAPQWAFRKVFQGSAFVPRGCGLDTVFREDAFHGISADLMAHVGESSTNPRIAFLRHREHELTYRFHHARSPWTAPLAPIVLCRDELSVPAQQCVRCHEVSDSLQVLPSHGLRLRCQAPTLVIRETKSVSAELLPENSILFLQVFDRILLGSVDPPCEGQREGRHRPHFSRSGQRGYSYFWKTPPCEVLLRVGRVLAHYGVEQYTDLKSVWVNLGFSHFAFALFRKSSMVAVGLLTFGSVRISMSAGPFSLASSAKTVSNSSLLVATAEGIP